MSYQNYCTALAPLEEFPAAAFEAGPGASQDLCDFVIMLAVVHSDLKDAYLAHALLAEQEPPVKPRVTPARGEYFGLKVHLHRLVAGVVDELLDSIRKDANPKGSKVLEEQCFRKTLKSLGKRLESNWRGIVDIALKKETPESLAKALAIVRNHVSFHYDHREIGKAFRRRFCGDSRMDVPLLSRGTNMAGTRFYFADASVEARVFSTAETVGVGRFLKGTDNGLDVIQELLFNIVTRFVEVRGFAWREHRTPEAPE